MPYIKSAMRPPYDAIVSDFIGSVTSEDWSKRFAALIFTVAEGLYGGVKNTRYFKQNELLGVCFAAALEYGRRRDLKVTNLQLIGDWEGAKPDVAELATRALASIQAYASNPEEYDAQRPGHLNYLITELTNAVVRKDLIDRTMVPEFIAGLGASWYRDVTGPYEDGAIATNGDTPGYIALLEE